MSSPNEVRPHSASCNSPYVGKTRLLMCACGEAIQLHPREEKSVISPVCPTCRRFFAACCQHDPRAGRGLRKGIPCHRTRVCFVDGAVSSNGQAGARSGIGCAIGGAASDQRKVAVDESVDGTNKRTNQRAELLAILEGIDLLASTREEGIYTHTGIVRHFETYEDPSTGEKRESTALQEWVIVSDSNYAVKGCTEWFWNWKKDGRIDAETVANIDLFKKINEACLGWEAKGYKIGFVWIPREKNGLADSLAKLAIPSKPVTSTMPLPYFTTGYAQLIHD